MRHVGELQGPASPGALRRGTYQSDSTKAPLPHLHDAGVVQLNLELDVVRPCFLDVSVQRQRIYPWVLAEEDSPPVLVTFIALPQ
eukprot:6590981-Heterocapsa_arctica.AAC.1